MRNATTVNELCLGSILSVADHNPHRLHPINRRRQTSIKINGAAEVGADGDGEAEVGGVYSGIVDAEICGEADKRQGVDAAGLEVAEQTSGGCVVVLEERRITVDGRVVALADNHVGGVDLQVFVERRAFRADDAVIRPEDLGAVGHVDHAHRVGIVRAGEGGVARRVPVLRQDHRVEGGHEGVDTFDDFITPRDGEGTAWTEIVLDIDDEKGV